GPRGRRPMSAIPVPGAGALAGNARRTARVRRALAAAVCILVVLAALAARHPATTQPTSLPVRSGDMVVLDLSASISSDTFSRIGETLRKLVSTGGRYGLVVFSNVAYEALPPGTQASALRPLIRYFTVPPNASGALPTNPWTLSFSRGTRISAGLDLAHRILVENHLTRARVVLISDLADDPADVQRLNEVATTEYGRGRTDTRESGAAHNGAAEQPPRLADRGDRRSGRRARALRALVRAAPLEHTV